MGRNDVLHIPKGDGSILQASLRMHLQQLCCHLLYDWLLMVMLNAMYVWCMCVDTVLALSCGW